MGIGLVLLHLLDDIFCFTFLPPQNYRRLCQEPQLLNIQSANIFKYFHVCKSAFSPFLILKLSDSLPPKNKSKLYFSIWYFFTKTNYYWLGCVMTEQWDSLIIPSRFPHSRFPQHSRHSAVQCPRNDQSPRLRQKYDDTRRDKQENPLTPMNIWMWCLLPSFSCFSRHQVTILSPSRHTDCICASAPSVTRQGWHPLLF